MNQELISFLSGFKVGDGCWLWHRSTSRRYGQFTANQKHFKSHQFSYRLFNGAIPKESSVLHKCNEPRCVRPDHLYLGTQYQNIKDCIRAGRFKYPPKFSGENHPNARLKRSEVRAIRFLLLQNHKQEIIAKTFGVTPSAVSRIKRGKCWN